MRTGAIAVRKVRGDVNPADLFTKHLPSRDKIHQLTALFGCEYRAGRAQSAPLLRPNDVGGQQGGHLSTEEVLPNFVIAEAEAHDISRLPHLHSDIEIQRFFPRISAAPVTPNMDDWHPQAEQSHRQTTTQLRRTPTQATTTTTTMSDSRDRRRQTSH